MRRIVSILFLIAGCLASVAQVNDTGWPLFRGRADLSGRTDFEFPVSPTLLWSVSTGVRTKSSPVVSDGMIYFGNDKGTLTAITTDGSIKWRFEAEKSIEAPPLVYDRMVIFGDNYGVLRAIDMETGKLRWSYTTENQISGSANVWRSGSRAGIIVGSYDFYLHCVDPATGKLLWKIETDNYVNGTPAVSGNRIVFGGCDGVVRIVDPLTGRQNDTVNIGVYLASSASVFPDVAYLGDYDGTVYALNLSTRKLLWKIQAGRESAPIMSTPAIGRNEVIVGSDDKYLYSYNQSDGKMRWSFRTNGRVTGSPVVSQTKVLFSSTDGFVYLLELQKGSKIWSFNAGTPVSSSPAVTKERFYILTEDGRLLAFGTKPQK